MIYICIAGKGFRRKQMPSISRNTMEINNEHKNMTDTHKTQTIQVLGMERKRCPLPKGGQLDVNEKKCSFALLSKEGDLTEKCRK